ncbi:Crp/Fnr family transcriptional regulator [Candidatus Woesebacteria bacterium]|nr:Crp/Fnr family transcriptional regulator [Candidatus Woesebacteria bacterium]
MNPSIQKKLDTFFFQFTHKKYTKGEILIRADENPSGVLYLTKGHVKVYCISEKGDEIILNSFQPISFFPMSWAINDVPNSYFYEALDEVSLYQAPKNEVLTFLKKNPDVLFDLLRRVFIGVDGILMRMTYLMGGNAYSRLIAEIIIAAKRFGTHDDLGTVVNISEKDLALQTGLTRETVSREMGVLKKKGLVSFNKKVLKVFDMKHLTAELSDV